jgi:deazaflavin-dependent oxidoreductase (nitroreductase family)
MPTPRGTRKVILLTTTGARSGELRVVPLAPNYRGDTLYLSSFREDRDPDWFHNIRANPAVTVETGTETRRGTATTLAGATGDYPLRPLVPSIDSV